jgi:tetratricopeptide (TPR) repeat protein
MPDSEDLFTKATGLIKQDRLDEAFSHFQVLIKTDSNNATIWNYIGIIRFRQGRYHEAGNAFGQAADIDSRFTSALFNKSLALVHLGKDTEALHALDKLLKINPRDNEAQSQRALIVRNMARAVGTQKPDPVSVQSRLRV